MIFRTTALLSLLSLSALIACSESGDTTGDTGGGGMSAGNDGGSSASDDGSGSGGKSDDGSSTGGDEGGSGGSPDGSGGKDGSGGEDALGGAAGGGGDGTGGGATERTCETVLKEMDSALTKARSCSGQLKAECGETRSTVCGCPQPVDAGNTEALKTFDSLKAEYLKRSCISICPAVLCLPVDAATCENNLCVAEPIKQIP